MNHGIDKKDCTIVLVDDSDFYRGHLKQILEDNGFNVIGEGRNGHEGLAQVKMLRPHIVITDVVMPEMSGIELTEKIMGLASNTTVIVISSLNQEQIVLQAISAGASDFIQKPVSSLQLIESIEKAMSNISVT